MTKLFLILIVTTGCLTSSAITRYQLINKKTNQYIFDSWYSGKKIGFTLVTKTDKCIESEVMTNIDNLDLFLDSLKKCGFQKWKNETDVSKYYKCSITIDTLYFFKTINTDSLFKFIYKYEITDLENKIVKHYHTEFVTDKQKVFKGINNKSYTFRADKINGTSIIDISISSTEIYNVDRQAIFQGGTVSGFFM